MARRKLDGTLLVLAKLLEEGKEVSVLRLQELTGIKNFYTINRHIQVLKELGFIEETIESGPPVRRLIKLTEKGRRAARLAKELLELAGMI